MLEKLQEYGKVLNMHLNLDRRTGYLKGYCVAQYETKEEAAAAIEGLDGQEFVDRVLHADWAFMNTKSRRWSSHIWANLRNVFLPIIIVRCLYLFCSFQSLLWLSDLCNE